jgi:hypothetical protein
MPSFLRRVWPEGLQDFMATGSWHPSSSVSQVEDEWRGRQDSPPWPYLARSAKTYFARLAEANARRRKDDPSPAVSAQRFVRDRMWNDHPPAQEPAPLPEMPLSWAGHPAAQTLRAEIGDGMFDTWLAPCQLEIRDGGIVVLHAPRKLTRDYVASNFLSRLERVFAPAPVAVLLLGEEAA